jgi:hypothetical protein
MKAAWCLSLNVKGNTSSIVLFIRSTFHTVQGVLYNGGCHFYVLTTASNRRPAHTHTHTHTCFSKSYVFSLYVSSKILFQSWKDEKSQGTGSVVYVGKQHVVISVTRTPAKVQWWIFRRSYSLDHCSNGVTMLRSIALYSWLETNVLLHRRHQCGLFVSNNCTLYGHFSTTAEIAWQISFSHLNWRCAVTKYRDGQV